MTYSLSNNCTKNYYNRTLTVQVIVEDVVTWIFLKHSVYMRDCVKNCDWFLGVKKISLHYLHVVKQTIFCRLATNHHHHHVGVTSGGRCASNRRRSPAVSYATSAERPETTSTCRIHVLRGLPLARLHCYSVVSLATRSGINSQTQGSTGWSLFRKPTDVAEHCYEPSSDARNDVLFFGLVLYCSVGDELVPSSGIRRWQDM